MENTHFFTPGQLLANVPGSLGFYPSESVIIMAFHVHSESSASTEASSTMGSTGTASGNSHNPHPQTFALGPVVRIDIDDFAEVRTDLTRALEAIEPELVFAFIVSQRPEKLLDSTANDLYLLGETHGLTIDALWHTPEIRSGEPYDMWFGRDMSSEDSAQQIWRGGTIPSITDTPSMDKCLKEDNLPELTRNDAVRHLTAPNPLLEEATCRSLEEAALRLAEELSRGVTFTSHGGQRVATYGATDVPQDAARFLEELNSEEGELFENEEALLTAAVWLGTTRMRDLVLGEFLDNPKPAARILLPVARTFGGTIRANAMACYAAVLVALQQESRAGLVLSTVLRESPNHRLASLMYQLYAGGMFDSLVTSMQEGSKAAQGAIMADIAETRRQEARLKRPSAA